MSCRSITSLLPFDGVFQWLTLIIFLSPFLQDACSTVCSHTNSSEKSQRNNKEVSHSQNQFYKTINQTSFSFEDTPFYHGPQSELPGLHSEPSSEQYLDDMDESIQVPQDVDIDKLSFSLDPYFQHLYPEIKLLLNSYIHLHPKNKNDVGSFPSFRAVLTPAPNAHFVKEPPRRHDPHKIKIGLEIEQDLLDIGVIELSESQFPCNALLTMKAIPFVTGSNTKADKYIQKTTQIKEVDITERKFRYTVDQRQHNSGLLPAPKIHLPKTSDILRILHGSEVCMLDIANAFHSIEYAPSSRQYTSFWGVTGTKYQFKRCCQGM